MKRKDLVECLELLKPALSDSEIVPAFTNFFFKDKSVKAYNDQLGIEATLPEAVAKEGFGVKGTTVIGLLRNSKAADAEFHFEKDIVLVKAGKSKIKLPYMPEDELIWIDDAEDKPVDNLIELSLDKALLNGIQLCLLTASRDTAMPAIMGVTLTIKDDKMHLYSCDGDALSRYALGKASKDNAGKEITFTIPTDFCDSLLKVTSKTKAETGKLLVSDEWAIAKLANGYTIYGRVIENPEPLDHAGLIAKTLSGKPSYVAVPKGMTEALARACVVAAGSNTGTKATVTPGKLVIATESHAGAVRDALKVKGDHPNVEALVSAEAVLKSLKVCSEIALTENCTVYRSGKKFFTLLSNLGE